MGDPTLLGILGLIFGAVVGPLTLKVYQSRGEKAAVEKTQAEKDSLQVATAKEVVGIVREDLVSKTAEVASLRQGQEDMKRRLDLLEERERHGLIRAAVHEAWDDMAFRKLYQLDSTTPPPPPLTVPRIVEEPASEPKEQRIQVDLQIKEKVDGSED